jgi:hypothetical protein
MYMKKVVKNTNVNVDFEMWLEALPELKRRGMSFSELVNEALRSFLKKTKGSYDRESDSSSGKPESDS